MNDLDDDFYRPPRKKGAARLVVTLIFLGALALVAWAAEKRFQIVERVQAALSAAPAAPPHEDTRAATFLADGERALASGNLDGAQTAIDKASVLAEGDPRVALALARVASAKADIAWLKLRLLAPDATDALRVARTDLDDHVTVALRASQEAVANRPDDPVALTARIDALRLAGQTDAAHALVVTVFGRAAQAETAYVLAALEMTQPAPAWPSIVERLRVAVSGEGGSGRARAALVYALARSGDLAGARTEMSLLESLARPYPCLPNLWALFAAEPVPKAAADARDGGASDAGPGAASTRKPASAAAAQAPVDESGDFTPAGALVSANQAMAVHDYGRAEQIYQGILTSEPRDSQALSGLGDIARARGDMASAISNYRRAVAVNPSYLPALLGLGDTQWFSGDKAAAASVYKNIEDHFPEGSYPDYVRDRAQAPKPAQ